MGSIGELALPDNLSLIATKWALSCDFVGQRVKHPRILKNKNDSHKCEWVSPETTPTVSYLVVFWSTAKVELIDWDV